MGGSTRTWLGRFLGILVVPVLVLGLLVGLAPASLAAPVRARTSPAPAGQRLAALPASLRTALHQAFGAPFGAPAYSQQAQLAASGATPGNNFGYSVALSAAGGTAVVGAPFDNSGTGLAYVFSRQGAGWVQTAELSASDGTPGNGFGYSVAVSSLGDTVVVGAPGGGSSGGSAAYVFGERGAGWVQTAELTASDGTPGNGFGYSVAVSSVGNTVVVGAPYRDSGTGAAYVFSAPSWFSRPGTGWTQTAELTAADGATFDDFGWSVSLSSFGTTALVGAPYRDAGIGAAYVYSAPSWFGRPGSGWTQAAELTAAGGGVALGNFGYSVSLSAFGDTALVGAPGPASGTGAAYVFGGRGSAWSQSAVLTAGDGAAGDNFGVSVSLSAFGSTALVGAAYHGAFAGAAYVFDGRGPAWTQAAELTATAEAPSGELGWSVSLAALGTTALVGAPFPNSVTGAAYLFGGPALGPWTR